MSIRQVRKFVRMGFDWEQIPIRYRYRVMTKFAFYMGCSFGLLLGIIIMFLVNSI